MVGEDGIELSDLGPRGVESAAVCAGDSRASGASNSAGDTADRSLGSIARHQALQPSPAAEPATALPQASTSASAQTALAMRAVTDSSAAGPRTALASGKAPVDDRPAGQASSTQASHAPHSDAGSHATRAVNATSDSRVLHSECSQPDADRADHADHQPARPHHQQPATSATPTTAASAATSLSCRRGWRRCSIGSFEIGLAAASSASHAHSRRSTADNTSSTGSSTGSSSSSSSSSSSTSASDSHSCPSASLPVSRHAALAFHSQSRRPRHDILRSCPPPITCTRRSVADFSMRSINYAPCPKDEVAMLIKATVCAAVSVTVLGLVYFFLSSENTAWAAAARSAGLAARYAGLWVSVVCVAGGLLVYFMLWWWATTLADPGIAPPVGVAVVAGAGLDRAGAGAGAGAEMRGWDAESGVGAGERRVVSRLPSLAAGHLDFGMLRQHIRRRLAEREQVVIVMPGFAQALQSLQSLQSLQALQSLQSQHQAGAGAEAEAVQLADVRHLALGERVAACDRSH